MEVQEESWDGARTVQFLVLLEVPPRRIHSARMANFGGLSVRCFLKKLVLVLVKASPGQKSEDKRRRPCTTRLVRLSLTSSKVLLQSLWRSYCLTRAASFAATASSSLRSYSSVNDAVRDSSSYLSIDTSNTETQHQMNKRTVS